MCNRTKASRKKNAPFEAPWGILSFPPLGPLNYHCLCCVSLVNKKNIILKNCRADKLHVCTIWGTQGRIPFGKGLCNTLQKTVVHAQHRDPPTRILLEGPECSVTMMVFILIVMLLEKPNVTEIQEKEWKHALSLGTCPGGQRGG